jgi:transaldolase
MSLASLIATGTEVWLDGVESDEIRRSRACGATGATSNPTIVAKIVGQGHSEGRIGELIRLGLTDDQIAWELDDELVRSAQNVFHPVWERANENDGYVSFEPDPFIEDQAAGMVQSERVRRYLSLGEKWAAGHRNRMIKVPASAAGLEALAAGVTLNVTLGRGLMVEGIQKFVEPQKALLGLIAQRRALLRRRVNGSAGGDVPAAGDTAR